MAFPFCTACVATHSLPIMTVMSSFSLIMLCDRHAVICVARHFLPFVTVTLLFALQAHFLIVVTVALLFALSRILCPLHPFYADHVFARLAWHSFARHFWSSRGCFSGSLGSSLFRVMFSLHLRFPATAWGMFEMLGGMPVGILGLIFIMFDSHHGVSRQ